VFGGIVVGLFVYVFCVLRCVSIVSWRRVLKSWNGNSWVI
jgi:hypothetical protein